MALTKVKGSNFRAFVGGSCVAESTSCQVQLTGNMEDAKTQDSVGDFAMEQMTSRGWSVQVDSFDASVATLRALITQFQSDSKPTVGWDQTGGAQNRVAQNAAFARSGSAILNDLSIQASDRQNITTSVQYQGSGALS